MKSLFFLLFFKNQPNVLLKPADRPRPPCASLRARRSGDTVGDFCKRAAMFPFVIITPSVLFFSLPRTFPSFHRDTDEILMRPGTVGAPPGDPAVEYFNCTFYAKCLPSKDASALELEELRAVNRRHRASRSHNAQSLYLSCAGSLRFLAPPKYCATAVRWLLGCERGTGAI